MATSMLSSRPVSSKAFNQEARSRPGFFMANIFDALPPSPLAEEVFSTLLERPGLRVERIVSTGQASPADFWYDQADDEWVLVLSGQARLEWHEPAETRMMRAGDYVFIPAHRKHRVAWTDPATPTVWLAIHIGQAAN